MIEEKGYNIASKELHSRYFFLLAFGILCRYGQGAGQATEETMSTAGHMFGTAWTATKLRKALNPSKFKPSKRGVLKSAAKAALGGGKKK